MQNSKQQISDSEPAITVSRHAIQRHLLRSRTAASQESVVRRLRVAVQDAVDRQDLRQIDRSTFLAAIYNASYEPLWAVLRVSGPSEKPFAIVVCTVLTSAMVTRSFEVKQPRYAPEVTRCGTSVNLLETEGAIYVGSKTTKATLRARRCSYHQALADQGFRGIENAIRNVVSNEEVE